MITVVTAVWVVGAAAVLARARAVSRIPAEILSPVTFVVCGFFWIYVVGYIALDPWSKTLYLSEPGYGKVIILAGLCGTAFWLGFRRARPGRPSARLLNRTVLRHLGVALILLGGLAWAYFLNLSGGFIEYYSAPHGAAGAWEATTAYIYGMRLFLYAGVFILLAVLAERRLTLVPFIALVFTVAFLVFDAWVAGSRGEWLRLVVVFGTYWLFLSRNRLPRVLLASGLAGIVVLVVLTPYLRATTYFGAEQPIGEVLAEGVESGFGLSGGGRGNEVVFASALVQAVSEQGVVDFGFYWLHPFINAIPRLWWPGKPYAADFSVPVEALLWRSFGWVQERGAAPTGLADAFVRFSWASPAVWLVLGLLGGRLFKNAKVYPGPLTVGYLASYLIGLIYMIVQEFNAALYASMFMAVPLYLAFSLARRRVRGNVLFS